MPASLRAIPSVEKVLQAIGAVNLPRPAVVALVRSELASLRRTKEIPAFDAVVAGIRAALSRFEHSRIRPLINATGVLLHTNLGRAPLGRSVVHAVAEIAAQYSNLEFDLTEGERGARAGYLEHNLALLCGAEAATVVNNCAAALVLALRHFTASKREVIVSRGELIQIGGGFRIPDILEASGARLREVGTTNRTTASDYAKAITSETGMILKVHRSNFFMGGFVETPATEELAALARKRRVPFLEDLGSGAVVPTEKLADLEHEPTPAELLKKGVDLVTLSGDKLLGGPQAGIIAGHAKMIQRLKREPFFRALRCDKLVLSALETTVDLYLRGDASTAIPSLAMLHASEEELRARAERIAAALAQVPGRVSVGAAQAQVGGGTLPRGVLPSPTVDILPEKMTPAELASRLRHGSPAVVGCISDRRLRVHIRTIFPEQDELLIQAIRAAFS